MKHFNSGILLRILQNFIYSVDFSPHNLLFMLQIKLPHIVPHSISLWLHVAILCWFMSSKCIRSPFIMFFNKEHFLCKETRSCLWRSIIGRRLLDLLSVIFFQCDCIGLCHSNPLRVLLHYIHELHLCALSLFLLPGSSMFKILCPVYLLFIYPLKLCLKNAKHELFLFYTHF